MGKSFAELRARADRDAYDQQVHYLLGQEYYERGNWMRAAAEFRRTVELNPDCTLAWKLMGDAFAKAGIVKEAAVAYRTAIRVADRMDEKHAADEAKARLEELPEPAFVW